MTIATILNFLEVHGINPSDASISVVLASGSDLESLMVLDFKYEISQKGDKTLILEVES